jgi:sugar phosphate isomerase/epimerase
MLSATAGIAGALLAAGTRTESRAEPVANSEPAFRYCLNTSTIRGQKLGLADEIELVAKAGYHAIEPWVREIDEYVAGGGTLKDLDKRIRDHGLTVESAIAFFPWVVDDPRERDQALIEARRNMDMLAQLGCPRVAAPATGATKEPGLDLRAAGERYRRLLELGEQAGVVPQLEVWGHSHNLSRLSEALYVAAEARHPRACLLLDIYHLHRGGSDFEGLRLVSGHAMHVLHVNDYPRAAQRDKLTDADRVYPGDGVAPLTDIFRTLRESGFRGFLSLELFNRGYWEQDPLTVLKTGLAKTRAAVEKS